MIFICGFLKKNLLRNISNELCINYRIMRIGRIRVFNFFSKKGFKILGVDDNSRKYFFGKDGDISWVKQNLKDKVKNYIHFNTDITNYKSLKDI